MYYIQSKEQLQKEARDRAQRIREARKTRETERWHDLANIFESAFGGGK